MTYHSKKATNIIDRIRKTLLNYDLEIARVESEIKLREEKMDFYAASEKKSEQKQFVLAKIELENYQVFLSRLVEQKKDLTKRLGLVAKKYHGEYAQIFMWRFFEGLTKGEIVERTGFDHKKVAKIVERMEKDIIYQE